MLKRSLDTALAGLVLTVSIALLASFAILATVRAAWPSALRHILLRRRSRRSEFQKQRPLVDDFGFDHAVEAYESLIDATIAKRRV